MKSVFRTLKVNVTTITVLTSRDIIILPEQEDENAAKVHCRVAQAVLGTLCGYVEWVNMSHIMHVSRQS